MLNAHLRTIYSFKRVRWTWDSFAKKMARIWPWNFSAVVARSELELPGTHSVLQPMKNGPCFSSLSRCFKRSRRRIWDSIIDRNVLIDFLPCKVKFFFFHVKEECCQFNYWFFRNFFPPASTFVNQWIEFDMPMLLRAFSRIPRSKMPTWKTEQQSLLHHIFGG